MRIVGGEFAAGRCARLATPASARPPTVCARRSSTSLSTRTAIPLPARACSTFLPAPARSDWRRCRGARRARFFVEDGAEARGLIRDNVEAFGLTGRTRIFRRDATRLGDAGTVQPFSLVFADPPYGAGLGEKALAAAIAGNWLTEEALVVLEEAADAKVAAVAGLEVLETRRIGDSQVLFLRRTRLADGVARP